MVSISVLLDLEIRFVGLFFGKASALISRKMVEATITETAHKNPKNLFEYPFLFYLSRIKVTFRLLYISQ